MSLSFDCLSQIPTLADALRESGQKLFLHACCGPCAEAPILDLLEAGLQPTLYYYNPIIYPLAEWERRREAIAKLASLRNIELQVAEGDREALGLGIAGLPKQCAYCYQVRLQEAACRAREQGYACFTTSLLVSPYQNRELIIKTGTACAAREGITFLPVDWRPLYRLGQNLAREHGLYRQRFCACFFSLEESKWKDQILEELRPLDQRLRQ